MPVSDASVPGAESEDYVEGNSVYVCVYVCVYWQFP